VSCRARRVEIATANGRTSCAFQWPVRHTSPADVRVPSSRGSFRLSRSLRLMNPLPFVSAPHPYYSPDPAFASAAAAGRCPAKELRLVGNISEQTAPRSAVDLASGVHSRLPPRAPLLFIIFYIFFDGGSGKAVSLALANVSAHEC